MRALRVQHLVLAQGLTRLRGPFCTLGVSRCTSVLGYFNPCVQAVPTPWSPLDLGVCLFVALPVLQRVHLKLTSASAQGADWEPGSGASRDSPGIWCAFSCVAGGGPEWGRPFVVGSPRKGPSYPRPSVGRITSLSLADLGFLVSKWSWEPSGNIPARLRWGNGSGGTRLEWAEAQMLDPSVSCMNQALR